MAKLSPALPQHVTVMSQLSSIGLIKIDMEKSHASKIKVDSIHNSVPIKLLNLTQTPKVALKRSERLEKDLI